MHAKVITVVKPYLIRNGRPTRLVKKLQETAHGKLLVTAMFNYYVKHCEFPDFSTWRLNPNINIDNYKWCPAQAYLNNLRKAGL